MKNVSEFKNFRLIPQDGWSLFSYHIRLTDQIFDALAPFVNSGEFRYLDLFAGCGVFEDDQDNSLFLLFDDSKKREKIIEVRLSQSADPESSSPLLLLAEKIIQEYKLNKLSID
ncbi:hypothetical protein [Aliikangiella sp. G2MR2-5]|uniref:hypothetical protein n=1 Tax=Aliikangiella sp. G2MR2-5 TaxID=2788943 RepID=UPI0018AC4A6A|nr:hypothetical protein [Aliikangiella sp. G2MR2-5]